jgi:hypothetical protein
MKVINAPDHYEPGIYPDFVIFLGGSRIGNWRLGVYQWLIGFDVTVLDPYGDNQRDEYGDWDLSALNRADLILINIVNQVNLSIPFWELGFSIKSSKLYVNCYVECPERNPIESLCREYKIPLFSTLPKLIDYTRNYLKAIGISES